MNCPKCGASSPDNVRFCPSCGNELKPGIAFCRACNAELRPGAQFCGKCGQSVVPGADTRIGPVKADSIQVSAGGAASIVADRPSLSWGNLLKLIWQNTWQGLLKSLPMMIIIFVISMIVHTYMLVFVNEGFGSGTWMGRQLLATQGNVISATILWMLISGMVFQAIGRIRAVGFNGYISEVVKLPQEMTAYVKEAGRDGMILFLAGVGLALIISGVMSDIGNIFLAAGVVGLFASPVGRVIALLLQTAWTTIMSQFAPNQTKVIAKFGIVSAYLSIVGSALGFALAAILPVGPLIGFLLVVVLAVMTYNNNKPSTGQTSALILIVAAGIVLLRAKGVLADDGGWQEAGGTLSSWAGSEGSIRAVLHGIGPSMGAAVGPALSSSLSGIGPNNFAPVDGVSDDEGDDGSSGDGGYDDHTGDWSDEGQPDSTTDETSSDADDSGDSQDTGQEGEESSDGEGDDNQNDEDGYDEDGYDKDGYDRNGYDRDGFDRNGYDRDGYDRNGYDSSGFDRDGFNSEGLDRDGFYSNGFDKEGYDRNGLDAEGYDRSGLNQEGFDREGYDKDGFDSNGLDRTGYDRDGFDQQGYDRNGYDREGYDSWGYDKDGFDSDGYDQQGYDRNGYDASGRDSNGYDKSGYDESGYDKDGFNKNGYDSWGYDKNGYDKDGWDQYGYDRNGFDTNGRDIDGFDRNGLDRNGFNRDGVNKDGKTREEVLAEIKERMEKSQKESADASSSAWWWDKAASAGEWVVWGADKSIDVLSNVTGPAGGRVKDIYTVAKGTAEGLGQAYADGTSLVGGAAKGTLKGATDLGLGKIMDAGAGKITDLTGGKVPGFKEYTAFNPADDAWKNARTGFVKDALMGKGAVDDTVRDMVRDKFTTAGKNVLQGTVRDSLSKDPIMDGLFPGKK
ncbi:MAG: zinc-ribbon domain-containing protein [Syntrophomonadaceae bacterium]